MTLWKNRMLQQWPLLDPARLWALLLPWVPGILAPANWQAPSVRCRPAMKQGRGLQRQRQRQLRGQRQTQGGRLLPCKTVGCKPPQAPACLPCAPGLQAVTSLLPLPPLLLLPHRQEMRPVARQVGLQRDRVV